MRGRRFIAAGVAVLTSIVVALAPSEVEGQQPVFRASTTIVEVHVVVRDRDGKFVTGLGPADFQVVEDGRAIPIESMYVVTAPSGAAAGETANGARREGRTFVFAFDAAHLSPRSFTRARDAAVEFARQRLSTGDRSTAVTIGQSNARPLSDSQTALVRSLEAMRPSTELAGRELPLRQWPRITGFQEAADIARNNASVLSQALYRECRARDLDCEVEADPAATTAPRGKNLGGMKGLGDRETTESELRAKAASYIAQTTAVAARSIGSLEALARTLEGIRGRKTIIWFTEGTPVLEAARQARDAAARAAQSGVAVYSVDPRGLQSRTSGVDEIATQQVGLDVFSDTGDLAALMASGTGALAIRNENRLDRALARIEDDTSNYYVIGYAAIDAARREGRRLKVEVRRDGIDARIRHGFMAPQHGYAKPGAMVAASLNTAPGTEAAMSAPAPLPPTRTTAPTPGHVPTPASKVLRLRDMSAEAASDLARRGWQAYERGDIESALPLLEQAAAREDVRPWALYALGFAYVGANRTRDAVAAWERVRAAAPEFQPVYLDLASHYAQLGEHGAALERLRSAERQWPSDAEIHNGIGVLLARRMAYGEAIESFTRATQVAPQDALSWLNLGRAHELRYDRLRRYDQMLLKWVGPEGDRVKAQQSYEKCVALGGPYAGQAAEALARMNWSQ